VRLDRFLAAARATAKAADALVEELAARGDVVVNAHTYGWPAYEAFHRRFHAEEPPDLVCLSMNPALHGAVQTGIPFTDAPMARDLLPGFDRLVQRPPALATERVEMSGRKLRAWADQALGGLHVLHRRILFVTACPVAVLRGPRLLNVPLPALRGRRRRAADAFYQEPKGLFLLGDYAGGRWIRIARVHPDVGRIPSTITHHPAARISNETKFHDWSLALSTLEREVTGTGPIPGS